MAEGTRFKELHDLQKKQEVLLVEERALRTANEKYFETKLAGLQTKLAGLQAKQLTLEQTLETMRKNLQQQMQSITDQMHQCIRSKSLLSDELSAPVDKGSMGKTSYPQGISFSLPEMKFPYFDGGNPRAWVRRSKWYFNVFTALPDDRKVPFAALHFRSKAEVWIHNLLEERPMLTWEELMMLVVDRFDDIEPELIVGEFCKLQQTGTVGEYFEKFDDLMAHVLMFHKELSEAFFISKFNSGLKEEIRGFVLAAKPKSLYRAVFVAKSFESSVDAIISNMSNAMKSLSHKPTQKIPQYNQRSSSNPPKPPFAVKNDSHSPVIKLLTSAEMEDRWNRKLCYNCDEIFVPGHRCKQRQMFMLMSAEEEEAYMNEVGCDEEGLQGVTVDDSKL